MGMSSMVTEEPSGCGCGGHQTKDGVISFIGFGMTTYTQEISLEYMIYLNPYPSLTVA